MLPQHVKCDAWSRCWRPSRRTPGSPSWTAAAAAGKCEPQYIPIAGGGGSGMSEAEIKLLVQNEVASLRDDLVGRMQTAASMATQPLEQALSETQAECRTLERLDEAIEMLKRAPGIEEVDQRLAFSDAKLARRSRASTRRRWPPLRPRRLLRRPRRLLRRAPLRAASTRSGWSGWSRPSRI